jgi:hypothetical protein
MAAKEAETPEPGEGARVSGKPWVTSHADLQVPPRAALSRTTGACRGLFDGRCPQRATGNNKEYFGSLTRRDSTAAASRELFGDGCALSSAAEDSCRDFAAGNLQEVLNISSLMRCATCGPDQASRPRPDRQRPPPLLQQRWRALEVQENAVGHVGCVGGRSGERGATCPSSRPLPGAGHEAPAGTAPRRRADAHGRGRGRADQVLPPVGAALDRQRRAGGHPIRAFGADRAAGLP